MWCDVTYFFFSFYSTSWQHAIPFGRMFISFLKSCPSFLWLLEAQEECSAEQWLHKMPKQKLLLTAWVYIFSMRLWFVNNAQCFTPEMPFITKLHYLGPALVSLEHFFFKFAFPHLAILAVTKYGHRRHICVTGLAIALWILLALAFELFWGSCNFRKSTIPVAENWEWYDIATEALIQFTHVQHCRLHSACLTTVDDLQQSC